MLLRADLVQEVGDPLIAVLRGQEFCEPQRVLRVELCVVQDWVAVEDGFPVAAYLEVRPTREYRYIHSKLIALLGVAFLQVLGSCVPVAGPIV